MPNNNFILDGSFYAFTASGGFILEQGFEDISYNINAVFERFDVTDAVQVLFDVRTFNEKIGLIKDSSNVEIIDSSFNFSDGSGGFPNDTITITADEFKAGMATNQVVSLGRYTTIYSEFSEYVKEYFGYGGGFASLFKDSKTFHIKNDVLLDPSGFIDLINGDGVDISGAYVNELTGAIEISNINNLLRVATIKNVFSNRDPDGIRHLPTDGFISGDLVFVPQGTDLTLNLDVANEINLPLNNLGELFTRELKQNWDYQSYDQLYSSIHSSTINKISRNTRAPLLLRLVNLPFETVDNYTPYVPHPYRGPVTTIGPSGETIHCLSLNSNNLFSVDGSSNILFNDIPYDSEAFIGVTTGTYTLSGIPNDKPIGFVISDTSLFSMVSATVRNGFEFVDSMNVAHYSGTIVFEVKGDFGTISYHSEGNGFMGGENRLRYSETCDIDYVDVNDPDPEPEPYPQPVYDWVNRAYEFGDKNWTCVAMSSSGQYQAAGQYQNKIYTSSDYGITWAPISQTLNHLWTGMAVSASGEYQIASTYYSFLYKSTDYGATFTKCSYVHQWTSVAMNGSGQYVSGTIVLGYIKNSADYGVTWNSVAKNFGKKNWSAIEVSFTGQYQTALSLSDGIYVSTDYGVTWTKNFTLDAQWKAVALSSTGQYQMACIENGAVYESNDYGVTWTEVTMLGSKQWVDVAISGDGEKRTIVAKYNKIYVSLDAGAYYIETARDIFYKPWSSIAMSFSGNLQTAGVWGGSIYALTLPNA